MVWTEKEIKYLKENYESNPNLKEISKKLNKSIRSVQHKGYRLGFSRPRFKRGKSNAQPRKIIDEKYWIKNKKEIYSRRQKRIIKFRRKLKIMLGGKCKTCSYNKCSAALDFHHNSGKKEASVSHLIKDESKQKALKEIKKCILLCANCHRELHNQGSVV